MSLSWDASYTFNFLISLWISFNVIWENENGELLSIFSLISKTLGCLGYFNIAFSVGSLTLSETGSL